MSLCGPTMPRSYQVQWAKEECLDAIDESLNELYQASSVDEWHDLITQRNRVAKLLKLPIRLSSVTFLKVS